MSVTQDGLMRLGYLYYYSTSKPWADIWIMVRQFEGGTCEVLGAMSVHEEQRGAWLTIQAVDDLKTANSVADECVRLLKTFRDTIGGGGVREPEISRVEYGWLRVKNTTTVALQDEIIP